jgi:hypothetical protein
LIEFPAVAESVASARPIYALWHYLTWIDGKVSAGRVVAETYGSELKLNFFDFGEWHG